MTDLGDLVGGIFTYAKSVRAIDINNTGQIIVTVPEPASYATMLAGLVLVGLFAIRGGEVRSADGFELRLHRSVRSRIEGEHTVSGVATLHGTMLRERKPWHQVAMRWP